MEAAAHLEKVGDEESDEPDELGDDGMAMTVRTGAEMKLQKYDVSMREGRAILDEFSEDEKSQKVGTARSDIRSIISIGGNPYLNMMR